MPSKILAVPFLKGCNSLLLTQIPSIKINTSDQIRDGLAALGIIIEDTAQGPRWSISQISEK
jgi:hypothetical protein